MVNLKVESKSETAPQFILIAHEAPTVPAKPSGYFQRVIKGTVYNKTREEVS